ncbi:MAG TPA: DUF2304 domain-containing protein [bacterium]|nr:DUF2304 domain-containing protein [bacterium]
MLIQIIISIFIFFVLWRLIGRFKKADLKISEFMGWLLFWLVAGVAVWVPNFLTSLANLVGIGRGADLVLYLGMILVFYFIFRIYTRLEKMERNITKIVRQDALKAAASHETEKNN